MNKYTFIFFIIGMLQSCNTINKPQYPTLKSIAATDTINKKGVTDHYRNLENSNDSTNIKWKEKQIEFTSEYFSSIPQKNKWIDIMQEVESRYISKPYQIRVSESGRIFFLYYMLDNDTYSLAYQESYDSEMIFLFNTEKFNEENNGNFYIDYHLPSWDGKSVVFSLTEGGGLESKMFVINVDNKEIISDEIKGAAPHKFGGINWMPNSQSFLYTRFPETNPEKEEYKQNSTLALYNIKSKKQINSVFSAKKINKKAPSLFSMSMISSSKNKYMIAYLGSSDDYWHGYYISMEEFKNQNYTWKELYTPEDKFQLKKQQIHNSHLYYQSGSVNNFSIERLDLKNPDGPSVSIVPEKENEIIESFTINSKGLYYTTVKNGVLSKLYHTDIDPGSSQKNINTPITPGSIYLYTRSSHHDDLIVAMSGWTTELIRYNFINSKFKKEVFEKENLYEEFDNIIAIETEYKSHDGAMVPLSIITEEGRSKDSNSPVLITTYGDFNEILSPEFSPTHLKWVKEGGVLAYAHIRGGGEKGIDWYHSGRKEKKSNSWKDIISAAEYLISEKYTSAEKITLTSSSGGTVSAGMAINERPELFKLFIAQVPLLNPSRLDFGRYKNNYSEEYGKLSDPNESKSLLQMDPYLNIKKQKYPTTLVIAAGSDDRLELWQATKYIAKLQSFSESENHHLLYIDPNAGHNAIDDYYTVFGMIFGLIEKETF